MNLPAALEALERPIGLPPSLLHKAEEVRLGKGPERIAVSIDSVQRLAERDQAILNEVGWLFLVCAPLTWLWTRTGDGHPRQRSFRRRSSS